MTKKKEQELKDLSFEQAIEALGSIVRDIETGQVPLQESLSQYEKGTALIAHCRDILQSAEKRIEEIDAKSAASRRAEEEPGEGEAEDEEKEQAQTEEEREGLF